MKVAMALVEGFEIVEATAPIDMLRRAGIEIDVISVFDEQIVKSSQKVEVKVDKKMSEVDLLSYDMLILPGGAGTSKYYESQKLMETLKEFESRGKHLAAICAAPSVFAKNGLLKDKNAIAFPGFDKFLVEGGANVVNTKVVVDGKIITARSAAAAVDFGLQLVEIIAGNEKRKEVEKLIVY